MQCLGQCDLILGPITLQVTALPKHSHNKMEIYLNLLSNKTAMTSCNLDHQQKTYFHALFLQMSERVIVV
jgi:hypothetical protein